MVNKIVKEIDNLRVLNKQDEILMSFDGLLKEAVRFAERNQICEVGLWRKFVDLFRWGKDGCGEVWVSWRSEYWGKMMRGASMVVRYTRDDEMYTILEDSVRDMLTAEDDLGRISGYSVEEEFQRWDLWGRKYVMLGMMYFMEISKDEELNKELIASMCRQADYIIERIGENKLDIRTCSKNWEGMNSCSILEPIVRLYRLTNNEKYLKFAEYIISTGFIQSDNIIELAYKDVAPHKFPVVKAYEMMSCFEGLLQYYYLTGIEKHKTALLNLGKNIIKEELSIIGCSGCTHELFDHTRVRQTQTDYEGIIQETCVTVTWMKFASALLELSGESIYADKIEQSFYNAYMGAFNTERATFRRGNGDVPQVLPYDSYAPLVADRRGRQTGGYNSFPDKTFYGCCACIGAAGAGVIPEIALMKNKNGVTINYYEKGEITTKTPLENSLKIFMDTRYPYDGKIKLTLELEKEEKFDICVRIPSWCDSAYVNNNKAEKGYFTLNNTWKNGDEIVIDLEMQIKKILPDSDQVNADMFAAYMFGPLVLAADKRICDPDGKFEVLLDEKGYVKGEKVYCPEIKEAHICFEIPLVNGEKIRLIDYASAGKTWTDESRCAAWIRK